jgi:hypothetical protein
MNSPDAGADAVVDTVVDTVVDAFELFNFLILLMGVVSISVSISDITAMLLVGSVVTLGTHFCS